MIRVAALVLATLLLGACASGRAVEIPATGFRDYGDSPNRHTVYRGSDEAFHYFHWHDGGAAGNWKVPKAEMPFAFEFPLAEGRSAFLRKDAQGRWQPWANEPAPGSGVH